MHSVHFEGGGFSSRTVPNAVEGTSAEPLASLIPHPGEYWFDAIHPWHDHLVLKHKDVIQIGDDVPSGLITRPGIGPGLHTEAVASRRAAVGEDADGSLLVGRIRRAQNCPGNVHIRFQLVKERRRWIHTSPYPFSSHEEQSF